MMPLPRILTEQQAPPPVYFVYPPGTPHPDPFLAGKGWESLGMGLFGRRNRGA